MSDNLIAIITDQHFGVRGDSNVFHNAFAKFYTQIFFPKIQSLGIKHIVNGGDVFDRRSSIDFSTLHLSKQYFFEPLENSGVTMEVVIGNHDTYYKSTNDVNSPQLLLAEYDRIKSYTFARDAELSPFFFIPWITKSSAGETLKAVKETKRSHAVGHLELAGFQMYKDSISHGGVPAGFLKKFTKVYSGHYHHRSEQDNIMYLGAAAEHTWSDYDDWRGFHIFDTDKMEIVESVQNTFNVFERIVLDDVKQIPMPSEGDINERIMQIEIRSDIDPKKIDALRKVLESQGNQVTVNDRTVTEVPEFTIEDVGDTKKVLFDYVTNTIDDIPTARRVYQRLDSWHQRAQEQGI